MIHGILSLRYWVARKAWVGQALWHCTHYTTHNIWANQVLQHWAARHEARVCLQHWVALRSLNILRCTSTHMRPGRAAVDNT